MNLTADQARELAQAFRDMSVAIGDFRFANWDQLTKGQRDSLEDAEWTLLNHSSDFITQAVGLTLNDVHGSLKRIEDAAAQAAKAVSTIKTIKKVIDITAAMVKLGAAIATENPSAIASATGDVFTTVAG